MKTLIGAGVDVDGVRLLLYSTADGELSMEYKGEVYDVEESYEFVPDGTYNQNITTVPYFVLDKNVYPLDGFRDMQDRG